MDADRNASTIPLSFRRRSAAASRERAHVLLPVGDPAEDGRVSAIDGLQLDEVLTAFAPQGAATATSP